MLFLNVCILGAHLSSASSAIVGSSAPHASPSLTFSDKWRVAACLVWPGPQPCLTQTRQFRKWRWLMASTRTRRQQNPGGDLLCRGGSAETNLTPTFCRSSKCLQSGTNRGAICCHSCAIVFDLNSQWNANWFPAGSRPRPHISLTKESLPSQQKPFLCFKR